MISHDWRELLTVIAVFATLFIAFAALMFYLLAS